MLRRAYMVICAKGPAVFLEPSKAYDYAAYNHGYVVKMYGQDDETKMVEDVSPKAITYEAKQT